MVHFQKGLMLGCASAEDNFSDEGCFAAFDLFLVSSLFGQQNDGVNQLGKTLLSFEQLVMLSKMAFDLLRFSNKN